MPPTDSREAWIEAALARYEAPLIRYALRITADEDRACDCVQDTFLKLCRADRRTVEDHLAAWLFSVCRHRALDIMKKERRSMNLPDARVNGMAPPGAGESDVADTLDEVLAVVAGLPERQQEVIRLKFQDELSYKEISQITGLSMSNVGYLIHVGLKAVRVSLEQQERLEGARA